jgi:hypothetical protein
MNIREQLLTALLLSTTEDLRFVKRYIGWVRFRRRVNDVFYPAHHWVKSSRKVHWVGR